MPLPSSNTTQEALFLENIFRSTASSAASLLISESFMMGVLLACVPLVSYLLWARPHSFPRAPFIAVLWVLLIAIITHWALSLRQVECTLSRLSSRISVLYQHSNDAGAAFSGDLDLSTFTISFYGQGWKTFLPIVTETTLCGLSSTLFAIVGYTNFRHFRSLWRTCYASIILVTACLMYALSLAHWAISLRSFIVSTNHAVPGPELGLSPPVNTNSIDALLLGLLYMNAIMSDSIVLWRMCVIWERARFVCAFAAALLFATLGVSIANIVLLIRALGTYNASNAPDTQAGDSGIISAYSQHDVGLVTALFVLTLASNLSATMLVALKACLNRKRLKKAFRSDAPRTLVQRVLELLVESGVIYTALWLLYCISISEFNAHGTAITGTMSHLDAAMAQITSIYPLTVFILVALDKIHHSRGARTLRTDDLPRERDRTVTVAVEIDVERSTAQRPLSTHSTEAPHYAGL